jgi:hypothetical protein
MVHLYKSPFSQLSGVYIFENRLLPPGGVYQLRPFGGKYMKKEEKKEKRDRRKM